MPSEGVPISSAEPSKGLPAVAPPSGKFIAQLFLIPLAIVCASVCIYYLLRGMTGGLGTPDVRAFLDRLRDPNPDIRWRAADDLAQFLQKDLARDARFASNPELALDLAELLREAAENHDPNEKSIQEALAKAAGQDADQERTRLLTRLEKERSYLEYLTACLGNVLVPAGVPLLSELALSEKGITEEAILLKRRQAVWSLANLGRNLERFDTLVSERQEEVLTQLEREATQAGRRGDWAKVAQACLRGRRDKQPVALGLDVTLAECAKASNSELRKMTALALTYWEGTARENQLMESTLVKLSHDDGFGAGEDQRLRGLEIRYHAALALARRGSDQVPLPLLVDMLSEEHLQRNLRMKKDGRDVPDQDAAQATLANVLKVIAELHARQPERDLSALRPALEQLTTSSQAALRIEAERVLQMLGQR